MAITFERSIKEIAFCGSPQYVGVSSDGLDGVVKQFTLTIEIWHGNKDGITGAPTIFERVLKVDSVDAGGIVRTGVFDISQYVLEHIESDIYVPTPIFGVPTYNGANGVWFNYVATSDVQEDPETEGTKFATAGVGIYVDLINSGTTVVLEQKKVFGHQSTTLVVDTEIDYMFPVYIGDTSNNNVITTSAGNVAIDTDLGFTLQSADSGEQIAYCILGPSVSPLAWTEGAKFQYAIQNTADVIPAFAPLFGMYFNGSSTYMDLAVVSTINQSGDYVELKFSAKNWQQKNPYGYVGDDFRATPDAGYAPNIAWKAQSSLGGNAAMFAGPELVHTLRFEWFDPTNIRILVDAVQVAIQPNSVMTPFSPEDFFLGASNQGGVAQLYSESFWQYADFNGVVYDDSNNWNPLNQTNNNGGIRIISFDNGITWFPATEELYNFNINCHSGRPKALKYLNEHGMVSMFPVNGSDFDSLETSKTTFNNLQLAVLPTASVTEGWIPTKHVKRTFAVDSILVVEIDTGWIYEDTPRMVAEMVVSELVWLETPDRADAAYIRNTNQRFIRRLYRRQTGYKFTIEIARPVLNQVR